MQIYCNQWIILNLVNGEPVLEADSCIDNDIKKILNIDESSLL